MPDEKRVYVRKSRKGSTDSITYVSCFPAIDLRGTGIGDSRGFRECFNSIDEKKIPELLELAKSRGYEIYDGTTFQHEIV